MWFESGQKLINLRNVYFIMLKKKLVSFQDGATLCPPVRPVGHQLQHGCSLAHFATIQG